ncbi:MAG: YidC/Oxa1 family membrane protein insertase [bacterium]|nr:YidC/Oxa1 family membrane protein insertase [bacterium]
MEQIGAIFSTLFIDPTLNVLLGFYQIFTQVGLPGAFGFSIIGITLAVRLVMHPFFSKQMETARKMKELKPKIDDLNKKHKNDKQRLQKEQLSLYKLEGINPASGCLFALVQIPLVYGLFRTLELFLKHDDNGILVQQINDRLYADFLKVQSIDPTFFSINLALTPAQAGPAFLAVPILTAVLQFFQSKATLAHMGTDQKKEVKKVDENGKKEEPSMGDEFQKAMTTQTKYFFPLMIAYFSYSLPIGLSLYWNVFSLFSIIQHSLENRQKARNSKTQLVSKIKN